MLILALAAAPTAAAGQGYAPPVPEIVLRAGLTGYSTASDDGCGSHVGALIGGSARTTGTWFLGAGADLVLLGEPTCTNALALHRLEDGRYFTEDGALLLNGPRFALEAGRRISFGGSQFDLAASGGVSLNDGQRSSFAPWAGASFGFSVQRFGLRVERGWHWVKIERTIEGENAPFETVRNAAPATLLMVTFRVR